MAKYTVTCPTCEETYTVRLFGPGRDRQYKLDNWDWTCDDCREKARQAENAKAAAANEEAGLPALTGSAKQVAWAEKIRAERFELIRDAQAGELTGYNLDAFWGGWNPRTGSEIMRPDDPRVEHAISILRQQTSASWWIDQRDTKIGITLTDLFVKTPPKPEPSADERAAAADAAAEATVRPESPVSETVAEIRVHEKSVEVVFPEKRDDFWQVIKKQLGYTWGGNCWERKMGVTTGAAVDRAAETGNKLLAAGFVIRIFDEHIRAAAVEGKYLPECTRWVMKRTAGAYTGWFALNWKEDSHALYQAARKIPGSKWDKPSVVVPPEQFEQVLDFAEMYEFSLSPGAMEAEAEARRLRDAALVAEAAAVETDAKPQPGRKPRKLDVPESVEVAEEFKE